MGNRRVLSVHQEHELLLKLEDADFGEAEAQAIIQSKGNGLALKVVAFVRSGGCSETKIPADAKTKLKDWQKFYKEVWGIKQNLSKLYVPAKQEGFNWLVVMLEGMTARRIVNKMRERMKVWVYNESWLDKVESDREPTKDYVVRFRDRIEADEELKNLSANDLKAKGVNSITMPERLMQELFHYRKTNQHLDVQNVTLCEGSRDPDGHVPSVYWYADRGRVGVYWHSPDNACGRLRSRQAVS